MTIAELRAQRAALITQARAILDAAPGGVLSPEDSARFDALFAEANSTQAQIDRQTALETEERAMAESAGRGAPPADSHDPRPTAMGDGESRELLRYTVGGQERVIYRDLEHRDRFAPAYGDQFRNWMEYGVERRDIQANLDTAGGFTVAPQQFVASLIQAVDNAVFMRSLANVMTVTSAESLGIFSMTADVSDPTWTSELATGAADSALTFGKRELRPHPLAKRILISNKLLRASALDMEGFVRGRFAYKFGVAQESAFMTGTGFQQPLGVFTASADGISTSRDVSTGNTTTSMTFDGIMEAKFTLKPQYWSRARWIFHRDGIKQLAKLKDGEGNYIWQMGNVQIGQPDRLLGVPVLLSEYAPNTFTTGLYTGIIGDFNNYWIADALDMQVQRLVELYAATNQIGLIARLETDGAPVLEEAFVRVKLA
jgi:HK97 family phage major capsid protein